MRDELVKNSSQDNECIVINTDHSRNEGTHWTCLFVKNGTSYYFDSFGYPPPIEVMNYCNEPRYYNTFQIQKFNEVLCGHYCVFVLHKLSCGYDFYDVCFELF